MLQYVAGDNFGQAVMGLAGVVLMPLACSPSLHSQDLFCIIYTHYMYICKLVYMYLYLSFGDFYWRLPISTESLHIPPTTRIRSSGRAAARH